MKVANVSFGKVVAVMGKDKKIKKINEKLSHKRQNGLIAMRDVTQHYKFAPSTGVLAQAAQNGNNIEIYITGDDVEKMNRDPEWKSIEGILSHLSRCFDATKLSVSETVEKIVKG